MSGMGAGFGSTMVMGQYAAPELATVVGVVLPVLEWTATGAMRGFAGLIHPPFAPGVLDVAGGLACLVVTDEPVQGHTLVGHLVRTPGSGDGRQSSDAVMTHRVLLAGRQHHRRPDLGARARADALVLRIGRQPVHRGAVAQDQDLAPRLVLGRGHRGG